MPFPVLALVVLILAGIASYLTRRRAPLVDGTTEAAASGLGARPQGQPFGSGPAGSGSTGLFASASAPVSTNPSPEAGFAISVLVADTTHNIGLGYMAGGSVLGAIMGYELAGQRGQGGPASASGDNTNPAGAEASGSASSDAYAPASSIDPSHVDLNMPGVAHAGDFDGDLHSPTP